MLNPLEAAAPNNDSTELHQRQSLLRPLLAGTLAILFGAVVACGIYWWVPTPKKGGRDRQRVPRDPQARRLIPVGALWMADSNAGRVGERCERFQTGHRARPELRTGLCRRLANSYNLLRECRHYRRAQRTRSPKWPPKEAIALDPKIRRGTCRACIRRFYWSRDVPGARRGISLGACAGTAQCRDPSLVRDVSDDQPGLSASACGNRKGGDAGIVIDHQFSPIKV